MVNAMVVGLFPILRYVVVTDRLSAELTPEEIEAVFGHEVGHVKHRHMTYYLFFMMVSLAGGHSVSFPHRGQQSGPQTKRTPGGVALDLPGGQLHFPGVWLCVAPL